MKQGTLVGFVATAAVAISFQVVLSAQQPTKPLHFEVASIRASNPQHQGSFFTSGDQPGTSFRLVNMPLRWWIAKALSINQDDIRGPAWLDSSRFDLEARLPSEPFDPNTQNEMLKALLVERFGLKWHEEQKTVSGYELVAGKKVLAQPATLSERLRGHGSGSGPSGITGMNMPMSELARTLEKILKRPVVDATHLTGGFDVKLMWRPDNDAKVDEMRLYGKKYGIDVDNLPDSVFTAIQEQLGLRLKSAKVPGKVIVVDQMSRQPTPN